MRTLCCIAIVVFCAATSSAKDAATYPEGDPAHTWDGIPFDLRIPTSFAKAESRALVLILPGSFDDVGALGGGPYALVRPSVPEDRTSGMWSAGEVKTIVALVRHLQKALKIDAGRVHAIAADRTSVHSIFEMVTFKKGSPFSGVCFLRSSNVRSNIASSLKKRMNVLAYDWDSKPTDGQSVKEIEKALAGKARTVELRSAETPTGEPYFRYWFEATGGRFVPGYDHSFDWKTEVGGLAAIHTESAKRKTGAMVYIFDKPADAANKDARALQNDVFFDARVRRAGANLVCWKLDLTKHKEIHAALGLLKTPAVALLDRTGKVLKLFDGKAKASSLAKTARKAAGR